MKMSIIQKLILLWVTTSTVILDDTVCMPLNNILNRSVCHEHHVDRGSERHSQIADMIGKSFVEKTSINKFPQFDITVKALGRIPVFFWKEPHHLI